MKALSIRAPWWWLILHAGKDIENRDWPTRYRGPILIHAGKWFNPIAVRDDFKDARDMAEPGRELPPVSLADLRAGGGMIVGHAEIVDCVEQSKSRWFFGRYGFVLRNAVALDVGIPFKGALGLFDVPAGVIGAKEANDG